MFEAAAKGGRDQVDWRERVNAQDNPQTDERLAPSTLDVLVNGVKVAAVRRWPTTRPTRGASSRT